MIAEARVWVLIEDGPHRGGVAMKLGMPYWFKSMAKACEYSRLSFKLYPHLPPLIAQPLSCYIHYVSVDGSLGYRLAMDDDKMPFTEIMVMRQGYKDIAYPNDPQYTKRGSGNLVWRVALRLVE